MKLTILMLCIILAGCSSNSSPDADLTLSEFSIASAQSVVDSGLTSLDVVNTGEFGHTVVVADSRGHVVSASALIQPGERTTVELELEPGWYEFTCRIVFQRDDGTVVDHYEEGMHTKIDVRK